MTQILGIRKKLMCLGWAGSLVLLATLSGCNDEEKKKPVTQVAASVDGKEISIHQINAVLAREGMPSTASKELSQQVLERLIDQQVLINRAVDAELDRDPNVLLKLEMARRDILSQAYIDKIVAGIGKPSDSEIRQYYTDNPDLFSKRRIYDLQEVRVKPSPEIRPTLMTMVKEGKSLDDIVQFVAGHNVPYKRIESVRTAEQIPLDFLPKLAKLKEKETAFFDNNGSYSLVHVRSAKPAPISEADARPAIEAFLLGMKKKRILTEEVKKIRGTAKIEYMGMFADTKADGAP